MMYTHSIFPSLLCLSSSLPVYIYEYYIEALVFIITITNEQTNNALFSFFFLSLYNLVQTQHTRTNIYKIQRVKVLFPFLNNVARFTYDQHTIMSSSSMAWIHSMHISIVQQCPFRDDPQTCPVTGSNGISVAQAGEHVLRFDIWRWRLYTCTLR